MRWWSEVKLAFVPEGPTYVVPASMDYLDGMEAVAESVYPGEWGFVSEGDGGLVMIHESGGQKQVVGYAVWDEAAGEITDLAVLPDYRAFSYMLLNPLMDKIKSSGREWRADARESTSLRLLRFLARRSKIDLVEHGKTEEMDEDSLVGVTFKPKTEAWLSACCPRLS